MSVRPPEAAPAHRPRAHCLLGLRVDGVAAQNAEQVLAALEAREPVRAAALAPGRVRHLALLGLLLIA